MGEIGAIDNASANILTQHNLNSSKRELVLQKKLNISSSRLVLNTELVSRELVGTPREREPVVKRLFGHFSGAVHNERVSRSLVFLPK